MKILSVKSGASFIDIYMEVVALMNKNMYIYMYMYIYC